MNGMFYDYVGATVPIEHQITDELTYLDAVHDGKRASYMAAWSATGSRAATIESNTNYTDGNYVDVVRLGDIQGDANNVRQPDIIDVSTRVDNSSFLILALEDDDVVTGGIGKDYIYGGNGHDVINGNVGDDHLYGEVGDDTIRGGLGQDHIEGGAGHDTLILGIDGGFAYGDADNDTLMQIGSALYGVTLSGGAGADQLTGGDHGDSLIGDDDLGDGDAMSGGMGSDLFFMGYSDTLVSPDNSDALYLNGAQLSGASKYYHPWEESPPLSGTYDDGVVTYLYDEAAMTLLISDDMGSITVSGFENGDAGLYFYSYTTLHRPGASGASSPEQDANLMTPTRFWTNQASDGDMIDPLADPTSHLPWLPPYDLATSSFVVL